MVKQNSRTDECHIIETTLSRSRNTVWMGANVGSVPGLPLYEGE
ncbi:Uncharacterised protein [Pseudomonas aeruginosa]|jgi:hypothetical protein|nr:Uncharacterised protein [Pseudomonas aeruginosa]